MKLEKLVLTLMCSFSRARRRKRDVMIPLKIEMVGIWVA
jgi:hypothetical protein